MEQPETLEARFAADALEKFGVIVGRAAYVAPDRSRRDEYEAGPWQADRPMALVGKNEREEEALPQPQSITREPTFQRYLSKTLAVAEALEAHLVWSDSDEMQKAIMLSGGGNGTGATWIAGHQAPGDYIQNAQFITATLLRLGAVPSVQGASCMLTKKKDGVMCGQSLSTQPFHP